MVWFYGISSIVGYLMPNPVNSYILNIYDLVWFGLVLWHINHCRLFNPVHTYILNMLYNCGRIFFISSFFILYILSFGLVRLRTFRLSAWVGVDINTGVPARAVGGCDNHRCHNKNPREEMDWGCE